MSVGSRPDGWWRDRAGAAHRLHDQLSAADLPEDEIVLVLEGQARRGAPGRSTRHACAPFTLKGPETMPSSTR